MTRRLFAAAIGVGLSIASQTPHHAVVSAQAAAPMAPRFEVDPSWPQLPNNWALGVTSSVAIDSRDHIWVLHRPRKGVPANRVAAPPVLEFDANGKFLHGWGGAAAGYDWPETEHGIFVDDRNGIWIGGSSRPGAGVCETTCVNGDDMLLKFNTEGKFLKQIGKRNGSTGSADTQNVHAATDVFVYRKTNELFVSDGYEGPGAQGNRRVIVFDADTGAFKRMWGGFGNAPIDARTSPLPEPPAQAGGGRGRGRGAAPPPVLETTGDGPAQLTGIVHAVEISNDGLVYIADRGNRRIQVFTIEGKYVTQVFINRAGPSDESASGIAFSRDADQKFMYVSDYGNSHIVVLDRKSLQVLYQFGSRSAKPGDFQGIHNIAVDSKGNLYTAEVAPGQRAQRFIYKGMAPVPTP